MRAAAFAAALLSTAAALSESLAVHDMHGCLVVHAQWRMSQAVRRDAAVQRLGTVPRALAETVLSVSAASGWAVASLTRGDWIEEQWGAPPATIHNAYSAAAGSELVAHTDGPPSEYGRLARGLGGLMAASFGLDPLDEQLGGTAVLRGSLPEEALCTENVHAVLDALPCGRRAGVAAALGSAEYLLDSCFHSLIVEVTWDGQAERTMDATVHLVVAIDYRRHEWTLLEAAARLLRQDTWQPCAAANAAPSVTCLPGMCAVVRNVLGDGAVAGARRLPRPPSRGVHVTRVLAGLSRDRRTLFLEWRNGRAAPVSVEHTEALPVGLVTPLLRAAKTYDSDVSIALARKGAQAILQFRAEVPPGSAVRLRLPLLVRMVPVWRMPPAQQRGFVLPPGSCSVRAGDGAAWRLSTGVGSVSPVVPDSSMPYNAMMISATVLALLFGAVFNASFRRFSADGGRAARIRRAIVGLRTKFVSRILRRGAAPAVAKQS